MTYPQDTLKYSQDIGYILQVCLVRQVTLLHGEKVSCTTFDLYVLRFFSTSLAVCLVCMSCDFICLVCLFTVLYVGDMSCTYVLQISCFVHHECISCMHVIRSCVIVCIVCMSCVYALHVCVCLCAFDLCILTPRADLHGASHMSHLCSQV